MTEQILTMDSTAIKLETLEALARGINFDLRNACVSFCAVVRLVCVCVGIGGPSDWEAEFLSAVP